MPYFFTYLIVLIKLYKSSICNIIDDTIYFSDDENYFSENYFSDRNLFLRW